MTVRADGVVVGGRSSGHEIEVWASLDKGSSWSRIGTVANNSSLDFGDVMFLAVPQTNIVYCAFRERNQVNEYAITVCRSDDGGYNWVYDSTVIAGCTEFVGAPWLFIAQNGGMPDMSNADVMARRSHIKYIRTLDNFETWGDLTSVWTSGSAAYAPGMTETAFNEILITIDHFYGNQRFERMYP